MMEIVFWSAAGGVLYTYSGTPIVLWILGRVIGRPVATDDRSWLPSVSLIIPVNNEETRIARKLANTAALSYPAERLQVLFVSDGSTDRTVDLIRAHATPQMTIVELPVRGGKAGALNAGLQRATNEIVVFSDASIELQPESLRQIVLPFQDPAVGCVSGEDPIAESSGEGLYGRYELMLRRLESRIHSIVGASGSFYAQRRALCTAFTEGMAPDFLSVLRTVERGYRAISQPSAVGAMTSVKDPRAELRTQSADAHPRNDGAVRVSAAPQSISLRAVFVRPLVAQDDAVVVALLPGVDPARAARAPRFAILCGGLRDPGPVLCVRAGGVRPMGTIDRSLFGRIALYFSSVNGAILIAWCQYYRGARLELWTPSRR